MEQNHVGRVQEPPENYDLMMAVMIGLGEPRSDGCDGILKGMEKERVHSIKSLMKTLKLTVDQAMNALEVLENEQIKYKELVEQQ